MPHHTHRPSLTIDKRINGIKRKQQIMITKQPVVKMDTKGISVLMPLYNGVEFLSESVPSFLAQTLDENTELLIGINGYEKKDRIVFNTATRWINHSGKKHVRVLNFPKSSVQGKSEALNEMVKYAQYDNIALLDVDDVWMPDKLEKQWPFLQQGYSVVGSQCVYFGGDRRFDGIVPSIPLLDLFGVDFTRVNPVINSSVLMKKSLCHWETEWDGVEDYDLWLRLKKNSAVRFWNVPEVLVKHRIHGGSAFNSQGNNLLVADLLKKHA